MRKLKYIYISCAYLKMYKNLPSKILHAIMIFKIIVALIPKTSRINSSNFILPKKKNS